MLPYVATPTLGVPYMALSNWATMAFDNDGAPCDGTMECLSQLCSAELYKNWLYIHSTKMWCEGGSFIENTIASINEGDIQLGDLHILATRGPQHAIFVLVTSKLYPPGGATVSKRMAGLGCNGYGDLVPALAAHLGVDCAEWAYINHMSSYGPEGDLVGLSCYATRDGQEVFQNFTMPRAEAERLALDMEPWVGVLPETADAFWAWLESVCDEVDQADAWIATMKANASRPFNQGDAYFVGTEAAMERSAEHPIIETLLDIRGDAPCDAPADDGASIAT